MKHMLCFNKHSAIFKFFLSKLDLETVCSSLQYRRRINTEGTAKAAGRGHSWIPRWPFSNKVDLKKHFWENNHFVRVEVWCGVNSLIVHFLKASILFLISSCCKLANAARNWINSVPQVAFSSMYSTFILLLCPTLSSSYGGSAQERVLVDNCVCLGGVWRVLPSRQHQRVPQVHRPDHTRLHGPPYSGP